MLLSVVMFSVAQAQEGWVLWMVSRPQGVWERKGTFESFAECTGERGNVIHGVLAPASSETFREIKRTGHTVFFYPKARAPWSTEYVCLSDTADPRGAKGTK
jgi:hypothetical protein